MMHSQLLKRRFTNYQFYPISFIYSLFLSHPFSFCLKDFFFFMSEDFKVNPRYQVLSVLYVSVCRSEVCRQVLMCPQY